MVQVTTVAEGSHDAGTGSDPHRRGDDMQLLFSLNVAPGDIITGYRLIDRIQERITPMVMIHTLSAFTHTHTHARTHARTHDV